MNEDPTIERHAATGRRGHPELTPEILTRVFVTHPHTDHTMVLPDLIFSPLVLERTRPLSVIGHPESTR
jgi:ribonuclease BN (tRNA processing enzyme)